MGGQFERGMKELAATKFNLKKKEVNSVKYTDDEKLYLSQEENLTKLKEELKKQGY